MKRQRGRNRGGGGGKPQQQNANRAFDSNGPEGVKARGNAQTVFEKYQQLARDAATSGDRVLAENYLQHAEHYFRTLRAMQPQRPVSELLVRDQFSSSFDMLDFEDEGGGGMQQQESEAGEGEGGESDGEGRDRNGFQAREDRQDRQDRQDRPRDDRYPRDDRPRNDNQNRREREGRWRDRDDRPRDDRPRDDRARDDRPRDDRPREDRPRDDRPRGERQDRDQYRQERQDRDPLAVVEPQAAPLAPERPAPMLRDAEGGESHAPAFLQSRPAAAEGEEVVRKPRRRRAPRSFEGGDDAAPSTPESEEV